MRSVDWNLCSQTDFRTIKASENDFSLANNKLGEGGFGDIIMDLKKGHLMDKDQTIGLSVCLS